MSKKLEVILLPTQVFGALPPALATLEQVMHHQRGALLRFTRANSTAREQYSHIDPMQWTRRIEQVRDNPVELKRLRVQYDERAISFLSHYIEWDRVRYEFMTNRSKIHDAIVDVLFDLDENGASKYPHAAIKAKVVEARMVHCCDLPEVESPHAGSPRLDVPVDILDRLQKIQYAVFKSMAAALDSNITSQGFYTKEYVIDQDMLRGGLGISMLPRILQYAKFDGGRNGKHQASATLFARATQLSAVHEEMRRAIPSQQNGQVNERQHATRLLDMLHQEGGDCSYGGIKNLDERVDDQNLRRLSFEYYRQAVLLRAQMLRESIISVVQALKEATLETSTFLEEVEGSRCATIDSIADLRVMINNCLAADTQLRTCVNDLLRTESEMKRDISQGAGAHVLSTTFNDARRHYEHAVSKCREAAGVKAD